MAWESRRVRLVASIAAGVAIGVVYTASPLTLLAVATFPFIARHAVRGLGPIEARSILIVLGTAFVARLAVVAALFIAGIPWHNDLSVGALSGDEAYNISRALRTRDVILGMASSKYDYVVAYDEYGQSSYLSFLTVLQTLVGPVPFGIKAVNSLLFVVGAVVLYRLVRQAYGALPAGVGLTALLFTPSLLYASTSALKESAYMVAAVTCLVAAVHVVRAKTANRRILAAATVAVTIWILSDLRRGGAELALAGLAVGFGGRVLLATPRRRLAAAALCATAVVAVLIVPRLNDRFLSGVTEAAKIHSGHVFTVGHAYKLLDEGYYYSPAAPGASSLTLTNDHAARFLIRSLYTFALTPLPWEIRSRGELALLPEQLLWYLVLLGLPIGTIAGWRRDPLVTALLIGFALPTAAVLAVTNGNVGTLVRLRGLVTPYLLWVSVLGVSVALDHVARRWPASPAYPPALDALPGGTH